MSKTIQIQFKNQTESAFEALSLKTNDTNIIVRNHLEEDQPILIEVGHELLNTQLDFSQIKSFYALYFNNENWFSGATISDSSAKGDFSVITQSKTILLIPGAINFELGDVYRILFWFIVALFSILFAAFIMKMSLLTRKEQKVMNKIIEISEEDQFSCPPFDLIYALEKEKDLIKNKKINIFVNIFAKITLLRIKE